MSSLSGARASLEGTARPGTIGFADLGALMSRMTGDEKHSFAATSTLDVLWVLYDRVLRVAPDTASDPQREPLLSLEGPRADGVLRRARGEGLHPE